MTRTKYHIGLSIAGTIRQKDYQIEGLINVEGRDLSAREVRHFLRELKKKNPALELFTGDNCDNQGPNGGCLGHPVKEGAA